MKKGSCRPRALIFWETEDELRNKNVEAFFLLHNLFLRPVLVPLHLGNNMLPILTKPNSYGTTVP